MISRCPLALFLLVACAAPADAGLRGRGLISVDRAAPASVERVERPEWKLGDRFVYRRGGKIRLEYLLTEKSDQGYVLEEVGSQLEFSLGLDLERKAEAAPNRSTEVRHFAPADHVLTWPLWVGKRWSGEYALEMPGAEPMLVLAAIPAMPGRGSPCLRGASTASASGGDRNR